MTTNQRIEQICAFQLDRLLAIDTLTEAQRDAHLTQLQSEDIPWDACQRRHLVNPENSLSYPPFEQ
jgi:hypothetical protein